MANKKNFSNILLENIDNEIPITFEMNTPSKEAAETTVRRTRSKSSMHDLPVDILERFTIHLQQQVLFLQTN